VQSRLGSYYAKLPGGGRSLFADSDNWKAAVLTDLKVCSALKILISWRTTAAIAH
jgi:hypothetical protein